MLHPTQEKPWWDVAGQQGAEQASKQYKNMSNMVRQQKQYATNFGPFAEGEMGGRRITPGSTFGQTPAYRLGSPRYRAGGSIQPQTSTFGQPPPMKVPSENPWENLEQRY